MSWPLSQDYNEAIQDPRNSFGDAELKTGEAVANALGIPMPRSGNFADVYEVRCPNGSRWAVKCFTREVSGLRERYAEISKYLQQANLPFMVDFQYLEQGVRIRGQWYPILKMQWVQGFVLNEFVRDNLDKKPILNALGQIWLRMARRLREAKLAHCDLQHGNVLFVPGSTANSLAVKLIDYDGMCVPALFGTKSGEVGHPAFQHPERLRTGAYNQEVDRFSLLSIAAGLRCLTVGGRELWDKYDNGDNLLFRQSDLQKPAESPLFQELLAIRDPQTQALVKELYTACQGSLDKVPLVTDLLPEEKPAGKAAMATAIARPAAAAQGPDWNFGEEGASGSVVRKRRKKGKTAGWVWGAIAGVTALLLVGVGIGVDLGLRKGRDEKAVVPVVQIKPDTKTPPPVKPPVDEGSHKPFKEPQLVSVKDNNNPTLPRSPERGSSSPIFRLSPTGDTLALAADERSWSWKLFEPGTSKTIRTFSGHTGSIVAIVFSPDGKLAVTAAEDKRLRVWDVQTGKTINWRPVFGDKKVVQVALTPDGQRVAWTDGGKIVNVWNFENKTPHTYSHRNEVSCVAFSPDGRDLLCGYEQCDANNGEVLHRWSLARDGAAPHSYRGDAGRVCGIVVSPDGKYLATAQVGERGTIRLWDRESGKVVCSVVDLPSASSRELIFSGDGRFLLAESGNSYCVFRVGPTLAKVLSKERIPDCDRVSAAFAADSRNVIFAYGKGNVTFTHTARLPDANSTVTEPSPAIVWDRPIDPDGDCKFQNTDGKLTIAIPAKRHVLEVVSGRANSPRLLLDIEGDFSIQVRVGGDFAPAPASSDGEKFSWIGAGLILWVDGNTFLRLERAGWYERKPSTLYANWEVREDGKMIDTKHNFAGLSAAETYLRLERRGKQILPAYSEDGQNWIKVNPLDIEIPANVKIGLLAGSTSGRTFAPTFDQFQLKNGRGKMMGVNLPMSPAAEPIVVKPPSVSPPTEEEDSWSHLEIPQDLKPAKKDAVLRIPTGRTISTKQEYTGPLDITIEVRGTNHDVSFIAPGGAMVTFRRNRAQGHLLNVRRPDKPGGELGTVVIGKPIDLPPNKWCTLHWQIKSSGMMVSINKKILFQEVFRYDLTAKYPVKIRVNAESIEVKSVAVKELKK